MNFFTTQRYERYPRKNNNLWFRDSTNNRINLHNILMKYISIVDFDEHQHYHDRKIVIWIKLYTKILTSYKIKKLTIAERWLYIVLLLLAPTKCNKVVYDVSYLCSISDISRKTIIIVGLKKMVKLELIEIKEYRQGLDKVYTKSTLREREKEKEIERDINSFKTNVLNKSTKFRNSL